MLFEQVAPEVARQVLLAACLQNGVYDQQCEPSLAPWLFEWVRQSRMQRDVCDAVVGAMTHEPPPRELDQHQLIELLRLFVADGDETARSALYSLLARSNDDAALCDLALAVAVVALDGLPGFVAVARAAGRRIGRCEQWNKVASLLDAEPLEACSEEEIDALLRPFLHEENVVAIWERIQQHRAAVAELARERARRKQERTRSSGGTGDRRADVGVDALQAARDRLMRGIEEADGFALPLPVLLRQHATDAMLWPLVQWLAVEQRPEQVRRLLITFRVTPPTVLPPRVYDLARDATHAAIQAAAIRLLSNVEAPAVRELAVELLSATDRGQAVVRGAIRLLQHAYRRGDAELVAPALAEVGWPEREARHGIGCDILDVAQQHEWAVELAPLLEWVYEHTPCMNCRWRAVEGLLTCGAMTPCIAEECRHDGCERIRACVAVNPPEEHGIRPL